MMAFKAEAVFGVHLVVRHRAPRLAAALALAAGVSAGVGGVGTDPTTACRILLLLMGCTTAVCASRVLAAGPPLASARHVAVVSWLPVLGRFAGVMVLVAGGAGVLSLGLFRGAAPGIAARAFAGGALHAAATAALVLAVTPRIGAVAAAAVGVVVTVAGSATPGQLDAFFAAAESPPLRAVTVPWLVLPVPWRAVAWFAHGSVADLGVLLTWLAGGLWVASLQVARPQPGG